ncbi:hypothetical protein M2103_000246 [Ereboglobus sp. PH5-5]|nr:hypothetical protein [Ereboglobus sp. PH5-5]
MIFVKITTKLENFFVGAHLACVLICKKLFACVFTKKDEREGARKVRPYGLRLCDCVIQ